MADFLVSLSEIPAARSALYRSGIQARLKERASAMEDESLTSKAETFERALMHFTPAISLNVQKQTKDEFGDVKENIKAANENCCRMYYLEERNRRLEARKQWNRQHAVQSLDQLLSECSEPAAAFRSALLQPVEITAHDDQHLFELGLKIKLGAETSVVRDAMMELANTAVFDFPPQTFLQKRTLIV